jgi:hypothetical protein
LRELEALPKLQAMQDWLQRTRDNVADDGGLARAMDYSLKRWTALSRYAHSAILPIDNNPVENIVRPIALGKKNWLFTGSERSGRSAAACWPTPNSTTSNLLSGLKTRWENSPSGQIAESMSYCHWS